MTNEQLAVLLISLWRECNGNITQTEIELGKLGYQPESVIAALKPMQGFSDMLRYRAELVVREALNQHGLV